MLLDIVTLIIPSAILVASTLDFLVTWVATLNIYTTEPIRGRKVPYRQDSLSCLEGTESPQQRLSYKRGVGSPNDFE